MEITFDDARKMLKRICWMDNEIDALIEDKNMDLATKTTSTTDGAGIHGSGENDKMASIIAKIADMENEIYARIDRLVDYKKQISWIVQQIEDKECQKIITLKFFRYMQMTDVAKATDADMVATVGEFPDGRKTMQMDYDMNLDMDTMKYDMSFDVNYEGKKYDLGTVYYSLTDGVVVTTDTLLGAYQLAGAVEEKNDSYLFTEAFARDFKAALGQQKYITLISAEDMTGVDMEGVSMSGLQDAVFTFYEDVFKGFETGMVKKISGGYAIQADGQQVAQLMINMLDFIGKNPEQVLNATEAYMMTVMDSMNVSAEDKAQIKEGFAELKASEQDFVDGASDLSAMLKEIVKEPSISMVLDSFKYNAEVKQLAEGFRSTEVYDVTHNGKRVAKITTDSTMMSSNETVTIPNGGMKLEELQNQMARLENKYNPVVGVIATWGWGGDNEASLQANRKEGSAVFGGNYDYTDLVVKNGRAYLPLRDICDMLGEDVGWEKATKTAYVMQNGKRVNMNVLLQDGKAFVGVRAFEQLGYTVTYTLQEDEKMVEIMK